MITSGYLNSQEDNMADKDEMAHYDGPAGGWGSLKGIARVTYRVRSLIYDNKT